MKFNIDDRIIMVWDSELRRGVVKRLIPDSLAVVVEFDDGSTIKTDIHKIAPEPPVEEKKREDPEAISITPSEFMAVAVNVAITVSEGDLDTASMFGCFAGEIHKALFKSEPQND